MPKKSKPTKRGPSLLAMNLVPDLHEDRHWNQHAAGGTTIRRRHMVVLRFGNIFGNLKGVFANRAKSGREFLFPRKKSSFISL
jgi:hypothetical protein